jgi:hypothetical protein
VAHGLEITGELLLWFLALVLLLGRRRSWSLWSRRIQHRHRRRAVKKRSDDPEREDGAGSEHDDATDGRRLSIDGPPLTASVPTGVEIP